jgi:hypothetical protein
VGAVCNALLSNVAIPGAQGGENTRNGTLSNNGELPYVFPSDFGSDPRYGTAGRHSTHPEEVFYSTRSLQLNAGSPISTSHIAHDERPPNTSSEQLQNGPTTYVGAVCNVRLSNATVPGAGKVENERDGTFSKAVRLLPFFLSLSVLICETTSQDINLRLPMTFSIKIPLHSPGLTDHVCQRQRFSLMNSC